MITLQDLRTLQEQRGRGRRRLSFGQRELLDSRIAAKIDQVLDGPRQWGGLTKLKRKANREWGIAASEFYAIVKRRKAWSPLRRSLQSSWLLCHRYLTGR